jgi:hypothetical protein
VWPASDSTGSEEGKMVGFCEYNDEPSGSIKAENFLDD